MVEKPPSSTKDKEKMVEKPPPSTTDKHKSAKQKNSTELPPQPEMDTIKVKTPDEPMELIDQKKLSEQFNGTITNGDADHEKKEKSSSRHRMKKSNRKMSDGDDDDETILLDNNIDKTQPIVVQNLNTTNTESKKLNGLRKGQNELKEAREIVKMQQQTKPTIDMMMTPTMVVMQYDAVVSAVDAAVNEKSKQVNAVADVQQYAKIQS
jgi:hypothetical protein